MSGIITNWQARHASLFGEHILRLRHSLHESELFTDQALAALIESTPKERCYINTMDRRAHDPRSRREGALDGLSGRAALEAVRNGNVWINIHRPWEADRRYGRLLDEIFAEFEARVPGLSTYRRSMTLLISSPNVQVYYHCDVPGQMLWQMRGTKRVFVYPNKAPFLAPAAIEKIVLGEAHETVMPYEPWFDEHAEVIDLSDGDMAHWPLNCPHRVVNHDCLNVSMTTEHWTKALRNVYAMNYANGILRRVGVRSPARATSGPIFWGKAALAAAVKASGMQRRRHRSRTIDFAVDPTAPDGVRDIAAYALAR